MNRKRDPRAPKDITDEQRRFISRRPRLVELRREQRQLHAEMVALYGSMRKAGGTEIHKRHKELGQQISRLRDQFRREERSKIKQSYFATMPVDEVDKQIDQMLCQNSDTTSAEPDEDEWEPPKPIFSSAEHERIADAFFGPDAETLTGEEALSRRIQVINDLVAFSQLEEPSRRAKMCRWAEFEDAADTEAKLEENCLSPQPDPFEFPSDQCIFCASKKGLREFRPRKKQRPDSLRRHLENVHLNRFPKGPVPCPREICNGQKFENESAWLNHAATVHKYDLHVKLHRSATLPRSIGPSTKPSTKPAGIVFVNDGETDGSTTEDSAIGTKRSCSSTSMPSSSFSECLDVIDPRILADYKGLVIDGEAP
jgi:hypothetical protein